MKKLLSAFLALALGLGLLTACGGGAAGTPSESEAPGATFRIAGLKGPTTMGMVKLMSDAEAAPSDAAGNVYQVAMYGAADEITPLLIKGELDVAAVPANLAAVLYQKTEGAVEVVAVNTLGVLYVVESGSAVSSVADLAGKTIYSTGKGTTPEYVLNYILQENGLTPGVDVTVEFKSEASEIAAVLSAAQGEDIVAVLPQPYATVVTSQNPDVTVRLNLTQEWDKVAENSMVTGVLVARKAFVEENPQAFEAFLADYKASTEYVNANVDEAAALVVKYGIIAAEPMAKKAIPLCNITFARDDDMKNMVSGYLQVLFDQNPAAVGGAMPDDGFYYAG